MIGDFKYSFPGYSFARKLALVLFLLVPISVFSADYYIDGVNGSDSNDGSSSLRPWKSLDRVNRAEPAPGDNIFFKRGGTWRGQLLPRGGSSSHRVTYGAYGSGEPPRLLGSYSKSKPEDWVYEGKNIWSCSPTNGGLGPDKLSSASLFTNGSDALRSPDLLASNSIEREGSPGSATASQNAGTNAYVIKIPHSKTNQNNMKIEIAGGIAIEKGNVYRLAFRAKADHAFTITSIDLLAGEKVCSSRKSKNNHDIYAEWSTYTSYFLSDATTNNARIVITIDNAISQDDRFLVTDVSFRHCLDQHVLYLDVGNIIFDGGKTCGTKVKKRTDLSNQGDFWWDFDGWELKLYSISNPASRYESIECALMRHIVELINKSDVVIRDLDLRYGAAHGIFAAFTSNIAILRCRISFIGGGDQLRNYKGRYGNGIEFWGNADNTLVENCTLNHIYDAALTTQGEGGVSVKRNQYFRYNTISNAEYSFEFWNKENGSSTDNVVFESNTCVNAGSGWGHRQRWDRLNGRHLMIYSNPARTTNVVVRNNVFDTATESGICIYREEDARTILFDDNCWNVLILAQIASINYVTLSDWQKKTGNDMHSVAVGDYSRDQSVSSFCAGRGAGTR
jgi:hypothetical protein